LLQLQTGATSLKEKFELKCEKFLPTIADLRDEVDNNPENGEAPGN
jgi:hypothetical protein